MRGLERSNDKTESLFLVNCHWIRLQLPKRRNWLTARVNSWAHTWTILPVKPRAQDPRCQQTPRPCATESETSGMTAVAFSWARFPMTIGRKYHLLWENEQFWILSQIKHRHLFLKLYILLPSVYPYVWNCIKVACQVLLIYIYFTSCWPKQSYPQICDGKEIS